MKAVSRRGLLKGAGAGAVAAGALAAAGPLARAAAPDKAGSDEGEPVTGEPVVARVRDVASGEVELHSGERSVSVHDRDLARRLARAARS